MRMYASRIGLSLLGLALVSSAHAATTVTGQITSSLILTSSCQVNGAGGSTGLNFGALNFGTANSLFTTATGQVLGGGGGALSILCSSGTTPTVKVRAGSHDGMSPGGRARCTTASPIMCRTTCTPTPGIRSCWRLTARSIWPPAPAWRKR
ncbi:hypothetical protein PHLH6_37400 [Pseudomonas sp. Seg1]|nr:hypothetical protein PHLH6_37400 [Pseudomonas sp. Seg1]